MLAWVTREVDTRPDRPDRPLAGAEATATGISFSAALQAPHASAFELSPPQQFSGLGQHSWRWFKCPLQEDKGAPQGEGIRMWTLPWTSLGQIYHLLAVQPWVSQ
jgi:hypothetical protein